MEKRVLIYFINLILMTSLVQATINIQCDTPVMGGSTFHITVTHTEGTANNVGYKLVSSYDWHQGSSWTFDVTAPNLDNRDFTYYGAVDTNNDLQPDETTSCVVHTYIPSNTPPSVTITPSSSSVPKGSSISLTVSATDAEGLNLIRAFYNSGSHDYICGVSEKFSCSHTFPDSGSIIVNSDTTFTGTAIDQAGVTTTSSTTVTITNSPPSFITTQSYFDSNPATKGVSKTWQIQATDPDGDAVVYDLDGEPSGMSIDQSGRLTWNSPDSTKTVTVKIYDIDVNNKPLHSPYPKDFTIPVIECSSGQTQPCYGGPSGTSGVGICKAGTKTCSAGAWGACTGEVKPSAETCGNGIDEDCNGADLPCGCTDKDGDKYNVSAPNCGPADCDDDKSNDPSGCPTTKTGCTEAKSKCAICTYPDANEYCDFIDNNCNGQIDEGGVCTCDKLFGLGKTGKAKITYPADNANFFAGGLVSFIAEKNTLITAYMWEFGNSQTDVNDKGTSAIAYLNKGDYTAKLKTIDNSRCEDIASITLHINPCQKNDDCENNQICKDGLCRQNETIPGTTPPTTEEPLIITINSPTNQIYAQKTVPLSIQTSRPASCSYSLNSVNYITIQPATNSVTGAEGPNKLKIKCANTTVEREFTIKTEAKTSLFDDLKGDGKESLIDSFKDKGEEMKLTRDQAQEVLTELLKSQGVEITKSFEVSSSSSLVMLGIKNVLPLTMENTILKITIPKTIASKADEIKGPMNFSIIENDPVIQFIIPRIAPNQREDILFEINRVIDASMLAKIDVESQNDIGSLLSKQQKSSDAMKITKQFEEYEKDGEKYTRITTRINPNRNLKGMALVEQIPKCLAQQIDNIKMDEKYRSMIKVINPDPLIMWQFEEMSSEDEFSYEVKGVLSEDCKDQIRSMGIADELGLDIEGRNYFKIMLPLLLIPLFGLMIVHFHRSSAGKAGKTMEEKAPIKKEKPREEKKEAKKEERKVNVVEDVGKFLDKEIDEAEKEFKRGLK